MSDEERVSVRRDLLMEAASHLFGAAEVLMTLTGACPSDLDVDEPWTECAFDLLTLAHPDFRDELEADRAEDERWETHPGNVEMHARATETTATMLAALGDSELAEGAREEAQAMRAQGTINPKAPDRGTEPPDGRGTSAATVPTATALDSIREAFRGDVLSVEGRLAVEQELEGAISGFGGCLPHIEALVRGEGTEPAASIAPMLKSFDEGMAHLQGAVTSALRPTAARSRLDGLAA